MKTNSFEAELTQSRMQEQVNQIVDNIIRNNILRGKSKALKPF
jgi:hypothetical protein